MAGQVVQRLGVRDAFHQAVAQHRGTVDQRGEGAQLVQDEQDGGAVGDQLAQCLGEHRLAVQVHSGKRLVHDQELGFTGQRAGDQHTLVLAAGEGVDGVLGTARHTDQLQGSAHGRPVLAAQGAQPRTREAPGGDHLAHRGGDASGGGGALRHVADAAPVAEAGEGGAEEFEVAAGERHLPDDRAHGRGLARAVGPEQGEDLSAVHRQVDAAQHVARTQAGCRGSEGHHGLRCGHGTGPSWGWSDVRRSSREPAGLRSRREPSAAR